MSETHFGHSKLHRMLSTGDGDSGFVSTQQDSVFVQFVNDLREFYKKQFATIRTFATSHRHVKDIWVPLLLLSNTSASAAPVDHRELLRQLVVTANNVVLVVGDPGSGKTTLMRKIAYDWACDHLGAAFSLILVVPLRSADKSASFIQMAVDYYCKLFCLDPQTQAQLLRILTELGTKVLICLDGLDEYSNFNHSPFSSLFAAPFDHFAPNVRSPAPYLTHKLIIASRPYACANVNPDFFPLRFNLLLPEDGTLYVRMYCQTETGAARATAYLSYNSLVVRVPLIITMVCYLADKNNDIPTNLTSLYEYFIRLMLQRESGSIQAPINLGKWQYADVITTSAQLALQGNISYPEPHLEFTNEHLRKSNVSNDSFASGFLLHKVDLRDGSLKAEFPHRSIQDFFAAVHCVREITRNDSADRERIVALCCKLGDSQMGRFLFGLCSKQGIFKQLLLWLKPVFDEAEFLLYSIVDNVLMALSIVLSDCNPAEKRQLGELLRNVIVRIEGRMISERQIVCWPSGAARVNLSLDKDMCEGIHLRLFNSGTGNSFFVGTFGWHIFADSADRPTIMTLLSGKIEGDATYSTIGPTNLLVWLLADIASRDLITQLQTFPSIRTLLLRLDRFSDSEVNFRLRYLSNRTKAELRHVSIGFERSKMSRVFDAFKPFEKLFGTDVVLTGRQYPPNTTANVRWFNYDVKRFTNQGALVMELIQQYLQNEEKVGQPASFLRRRWFSDT